MTTTRKTTRIASIILTIAMLLSLICVAGTVSAGAASTTKASKVSLCYAAPTFSKYGMTSYVVYIQTNSSAKNEEVYVHYNYLGSEKWHDEEAELFTTLKDGSKIWKATFTSYDTKYCIKYVADGKTYWDNNNGKDYTYGTSIGKGSAVASIAYGWQYCSSWSGYKIGARLQNYAYHKNVFVRYTTDGWKSYRDQALSYSETNDDGTENWTTEIWISNAEAHSEDFHYAICYRVNGKEYWANNFGQDYDRNFYIYH